MAIQRVGPELDARSRSPHLEPYWDLLREISVGQPFDVNPSFISEAPGAASGERQPDLL